MQTRPLIRKKFGKIETDTPYSPEWVNAIKEVIPHHYREWNGEIWTFDVACYVPVLMITEHFFGADHIVDTTGIVNPHAGFTGWAEKWNRWLERNPVGFTSGARFGQDGSFDSGFWDDLFRESARRQRQRRERGSGSTRTTAPPANPDLVLYLAPGAPWEVVQAAYRALAGLHHPDRGGDTAKMQEINEAYEALKKRHGK